MYDFVNEREDRKQIASNDVSDDDNIENYIENEDKRYSKKNIRSNSTDSEGRGYRKESNKNSEIAREIKTLKSKKNSLRSSSPIERNQSFVLENKKKRSVTKQEEYRNFEFVEEALQKKKGKIQELKAKLKEMKRDLIHSKEDNSRLENENQRYSLELETLKDKGVQNDLTNKIVSFQKEICSLRQRCDEEKSIREKYERQVEESEENVRISEERLYRLKQKFEEETESLLEKLSKRKQKIEALNGMIEERDKKILEGMKSTKNEYRDKEMFEKESSRLGGELSRLIQSKFQSLSLTSVLL